jgi:hypothetical protein
MGTGWSMVNSEWSKAECFTETCEIAKFEVEWEVNSE